jgi:2-polyprenyl-6-methoxyphenol hydroxylase-like FAD-dependent oxidoreductase
MNTGQRRRAIVVGAGIAGLTVAYRLHQIGWEPIVVERAPGRRDGGYALVLHGTGYDTAERIGILPDLDKRHFDPFELRYVTTDGRPRFSVSRSVARAILGPRQLTLLRGDLEDVLYQAVRDTVDIRFATTVHEVEEDTAGVRVVLDDGTSLDADLLIGADGVHSTVRQLVFGPEERFRLDLDHIIAAFILDELPTGITEGTTTTLVTIGRTVTITSLGPDRSAAFFVYRHTSPDTELAKGPEQAIADAFGDLGWVVPDLRAQLHGSGSVYFDSASQITLDRWSQGRTVLVGDAAWSVTLFGGYGASLAMAGADQLATRLQRHPDDVPGALTAWEAHLRPEVRGRQRLGRRNMTAHAPPTRFHLAIRNVIMRLAPLPPVQRFLRRRLQVRR